ncbi:MAG: hypothetical protein RMK99_05630 [Anaerolineales bacterium]|nr:hypothetical protein [Anaerolineales bacterium]
MRTTFTFRIINPFFVRAADNSIGHSDPIDLVALDKCDDLPADIVIVARILYGRKPAFEGDDLF